HLSRGHGLRQRPLPLHGDAARNGRRVGAGPRRRALPRYVAARALHRARPRARPPLAGTGSRQLDAVVVGAGPNGLAAAVTLAEAGRSVLILEARETIGGGTRTAELTLPGFRHDVCSAIHPLVAASPFFRSLELELGLVEPPAALAHPFD